MRRAAEVLTTLVLFAIVMTAIGWGVNASVPASVDWLWDRVGGGAVWSVIISFWVIGGYLAWRGHRPKAGKAIGR